MNSQGWWRLTTYTSFPRQEPEPHQEPWNKSFVPCCCEQPVSSGIPSPSRFLPGACSGNQVPLIPPAHVLSSHHSSGSLYSLLPYTTHQAWDSSHFLTSLILLACHGMSSTQLQSHNCLTLSPPYLFYFFLIIFQLLLDDN